MSAREIPDNSLGVLTLDELREELLRLRRELRWHRDLKDNDRCWHSDRELYGRTLPENKEPGRMTSPKVELRRNCDIYIDQQQCELRGCTGEHLRAPEDPKMVNCENCFNSTPLAAGETTARCIYCGQTITATGQIMRIGPPPPETQDFPL